MADIEEAKKRAIVRVTVVVVSVGPGNAMPQGRATLPSDAFCLWGRVLPGGT